jgi:glycogen synthase
MRIWILSSELASEIAGGIGRYLENFGRLLGAAGHEVLVIARSNQALDEQPAPGLRVIGVETPNNLAHELSSTEEVDTHPAYPHNIMSYWMAVSYHIAEKVFRLLEQLPPPDIIESQEHNAIPYYLIQRKLTERSILENIPILVHTHSPYYEIARFNQEPRYAFPGYWIGQMEKFCIRAADALLCPSHFLAQSIEKDLQLSSEITTIPLPSPPETHFSPRTDVKTGDLVYVGRLEVRKGILPLLKACHRLWSAGADFRLTLIGADYFFMSPSNTVGAFMEQRYGRWIESGHLRWIGQLNHAAVLEHMNKAWAVLIPSIWENFPNTCIEAMGVGQVVLGSNAGGQAEMIETDGVNGFIFDWQVPGDFDRKLGAILNLDPAERLAMAERAQARIRALCDPETVLSRRVKHYQEIIDGYAPKRLFPLCHNRQDRSGPREAGPSPAPVAGGEEEQDGLLSVLIPYYNLGDYLPETLESVLASTYSPCEVVIIHDGSTEAESLEVLETIENRKLPNVRILRTENQGLALTKNYGAEHARGEFIAFVDGDDLVEPDFFQRGIDVLQRYPNVNFIYSWVRYFGSAHEIWPTWNTEFPYLLGQNMLAPLAIIRKASFLDFVKNKKEIESSLEDYESWIYLMENGGGGVSLPFPLVRHRLRPDSLYQSCGGNQHLHFHDLLTQNHPELYREWGVELFNLQCANGPGYLWNHPATNVTLEKYPQPLDYQIAVKLLNRIRTNRIIQHILTYPSIRETSKKIFLKIQQIV